MPTLPRLTKKEIERLLLVGSPATWLEGSKKKKIILEKPEQRRLFAFLLNAKVRDSKNLPDEFVVGLGDAFESKGDPAQEFQTVPTEAANAGKWSLHTIITEGFGGLNTWGGEPAHFLFDGESFLIEGSNGSGKSSLVGAILWVLTGQRPRDQTDAPADEAKPVYGAEEKNVGSWPPIACYPPTAADLTSKPRVRVQLTFINKTDGNTARVERVLEGNVVTSHIDENFKVPEIFIETGLVMPTRLSSLRFDERNSRLTDAVQKLTGLDDHIAIGQLVSGLCHSASKYLSPLRKEYEHAEELFQQTLTDARSTLSPVSEEIPSFVPQETSNAESDLAKLGKAISDRALSLTAVASNDLSSELDIKSPATQYRIVSAIDAIQQSLLLGLSQLPSWNILKDISACLDNDSIAAIENALSSAERKCVEAIELNRKSKSDSKFQLKALASHWHDQNIDGPVEDCPLCESKVPANAELTKELESLRSSGAASTRTFNDNLNTILEELTSSLPPFLRKQDLTSVSFEPKDSIAKELEAQLITNYPYSDVLANLGTLVKEALAVIPSDFVAPYRKRSSIDEADKVQTRMEVIERCLNLAKWYNEHSEKWILWWNGVYSPIKNADASQGKTGSEIALILSRVSEALSKAEPYRKAAELMRKAWSQGVTATEIDKKLRLRKSVALALEPLKSLGALAESVASEAIQGLSGRIEAMLASTLLSEKLKFKKTGIARKEGLILHGSLHAGLHIDATLIANTGWLRAVLWAFIFSLREEAVEQSGLDPLPLLVFDDPQATFDVVHRHRWAQYIASRQQKDVSNMQVILVSHDEAFLELIKVSGIIGRDAMLLGPWGPSSHTKIFEGASLDRKWTEVCASAAPDWKSYIAKVREYLEGLLRIMLRGEGAFVQSPLDGFVIGESRNQIDLLNSKGLAPWNRTEFRTLVNILDKTKSAIKHLELAHHTGNHLNEAEAKDVEAHWRKNLKSALNRAFRVAREYYQLHGPLAALHEEEPTASLPPSYASLVKAIPLRVLGRAAALSEGRTADGCIDMEDFSQEDFKRIYLDKHMAFRLTASTLEPVARKGDILLVRNDGDLLPKSLVVALSGGRMLARRYEIADNHSDVAVLTAHSVNPHQIASPIVAHKATLTMHQVIGVIYGHDIFTHPESTDAEFGDCGGEAVLSRFTSEAVGLVTVEGHSAVPYALHGQYLIIGKPVNNSEELQRLIGKPVIASDTSDKRYFKRLQMPAESNVVLESLDSGGTHEPVLLGALGGNGNCLQTLWPVLGVLFER